MAGGTSKLSELLDPVLDHIFGGGAALAQIERILEPPSIGVSEQVARDSPVPSLFLTSAEDEVIPPRGVIAFARRCVELQPSRLVRVEMLRRAARLPPDRPADALACGTGRQWP